LNDASSKHAYRTLVRACAMGLLLCGSMPMSAGTPATGDPKDAAAHWPSPGRDAALTRYAPLADISPANVASLKPVFTHATGVLRGHEAAPIVVGDTMYIVTPYPHRVEALDLAHAGSLRWRFDPRADAYAQGVACCDVVNRGLAYANGKVFFNTLDNQTIALDAASGRELWRFRSGDVKAGETRTMAPLVVNGRVLIGNSGSAFGVRGWLAALDEANGKELWRAYSTGPDADVLIGADYRPFYAKDRGTDLGVTSWPSDGWKVGGGTVWGWLSYDAKLDLIYYGTSNPAPLNAAQRPGANRYTSGIFARDARTGMARWFYQLSPHDEFGYGAVNEKRAGRTRVGRPHACGLAAPGSERLRLRDRPGRTAKCCRPNPLRRSTPRPVSISRPANCAMPRPSCNAWARSCATSVPAPRERRAGSLRPIRRGRGCCTSRTRTCARTSR
jgi:PQQ-dependent dehydrogenase (methanol/ethanol family)